MVSQLSFSARQKQINPEKARTYSTFKARCTIIFSKKSSEKAKKRRINYCENQEISILALKVTATR
jgi:hypothetical protein